MEKPIDYLMDLELELAWLSGLCDVLCAAGESRMELAQESVGNSFMILRDLLSAKAAEAGKVVSEYYEAQAAGAAAKP